MIGCPSRDVSNRQPELAEDLEIGLSDCDLPSVAFVTTQESVQIVNLAAVKRIELKPGDRVVQSAHYSLGCLEEVQWGRSGSVARQ